MPVPTFALIGPGSRGNMVEQEKCNAGPDAKKTVLVVEDEVLIRLVLVGGNSRCRLHSDRS